MKYLFYIFFCCFYQTIIAQETLFEKTDTLDALVEYNSNYILSENYFKKGNIKPIVDSLFEAKLIDEVSHQLLLKSFQISFTERNIILDSLFSLNPVPYPIINEIQRINFYHKTDVSPLAERVQDLTGDSPYPASILYAGTWDNKRVKHVDLPVYDSSLILQLTHSDFSYVHPVCISSRNKYKGIVTSKQGWRDGKRHNGVDIQMDQWDSVQSAFNGKVRFAKDYEGYGKLVIVRHYNGLETWYAHLAKIKVKPNQEIKAGDLIGLAGNTGNSDGSHLHFEIRFRDEVLNPENIIDFKTFSLRTDTLLLKKNGKSFIALPYGETEHIIERGDYPMKIAGRYGMNLEDFCELNSIHSRSRLIVGNKLKIICE